MKKSFILLLLFSLSFFVYADEKGLSINAYGGIAFPLQPNIYDGWSEPYNELPYLYTVENRYNDSIFTSYGIELGYYFLRSSGIYISYETSNKVYDAKYIGKYPLPKSPNILRTLEVDDTIKFEIFESSIGFKHKYVNNKHLFGETFLGITVFHGTPTFMKDITVSESKDHKSVSLKDIEFFDKHYSTLGLNIGINLYKKFTKGIMFGFIVKYVYGNFKIEKEGRDDFIIPIQSVKTMISLRYSI